MRPDTIQKHIAKIDRTITVIQAQTFNKIKKYHHPLYKGFQSDWLFDPESTSDKRDSAISQLLRKLEKDLRELKEKKKALKALQ